METGLQKTDIQAALKSGVPLFHGLSDEILDRAVGLARREKRTKGETLFAEGETAEAFYLILAGCPAPTPSSTMRCRASKRGWSAISTWEGPQNPEIFDDERTERLVMRK